MVIATRNASTSPDAGVQGSGSAIGGTGGDCGMGVLVGCNGGMGIGVLDGGIGIGSLLGGGVVGIGGMGVG